MVIPVYGSQRTLGDCLASLARQSFPSFEVVIVDSSPEPACGDLADTFPGVRYRRSDRRLYPHEARNRGAAEARGDLLAFADLELLAVTPENVGPEAGLVSREEVGLAAQPGPRAPVGPDEGLGPPREPPDVVLDEGHRRRPGLIDGAGPGRGEGRLRRQPQGPDRRVIGPRHRRRPRRLQVHQQHLEPFPQHLAQERLQAPAGPLS